MLTYFFTKFSFLSHVVVVDRKTENGGKIDRSEDETCLKKKQKNKGLKIEKQAAHTMYKI